MRARTASNSACFDLLMGGSRPWSTRCAAALPATNGRSLARFSLSILRRIAANEDRSMSIQQYGIWRSNAAFRVRVALALTQLPFEEISGDILSGRQFDADYAAVNAEHVVPTLVY